jgi:hypothetical protein
MRCASAGVTGWRTRCSVSMPMRSSLSGRAGHGGCRSAIWRSYRLMVPRRQIDLFCAAPSIGVKGTLPIQNRGYRTLTADEPQSLRVTGAPGRQDPCRRIGPRNAVAAASGVLEYSGSRLRNAGMVLGRSEVNRKAEVRADADRPRDDLSVFDSNLHQESVKIPEPLFPLSGWHGRPGMARLVFTLLVSL